MRFDDDDYLSRFEQRGTYPRAASNALYSAIGCAIFSLFVFYLLVKAFI